MKMTVETLVNGVKLVRLAGRLDMAGTGSVETMFTSHTATQKLPIVVDFSEVEFLASIGIRMLLVNAKAQAGRGGKIVLYGLVPLVKETLTMAGIQHLIPFYDDLDAACADVLSVV